MDATPSFQVVANPKSSRPLGQPGPYGPGLPGRAARRDDGPGRYNDSLHDRSLRAAVSRGRSSSGASYDSFDEEFRALTGHAPFPWQRELFRVALAGPFPAACNLMTGLGKTSVVAVWLLALATRARRGTEAGFPRRLVYVVNRRTVVDQATREVEKLVAALDSEPALSVTREALCALGALEAATPLSVSTLRGQFADNAHWRVDPARPAVVVGTVDMVGSRLLFSGYGCGFRSRAVHAGLLGQDVLLVHDEAHLEPAFQDLLVAVQAEQDRGPERGRFQVVALTATSRDAAAAFGLTPGDREHRVVQQRIGARKALSFASVASDDEVPTEVVRHAAKLLDGGRATLVFLRRVDHVERVAAQLRKAKARVQVLTGTLRGLERDALVRTDPVFARFSPQPAVAPAEGAVFLICTSAGEVGIDISADDLLCDLTPFDSMAQRLGRVNRYGNGEAKVVVFHPELDDSAEADPFERARARTLDLLRALPAAGRDEAGPRDASPAALAEVPVGPRVQAFTPPPVVPGTTDVLLDAWTLTSIRSRLPGRPPVADWLHGVAPWEPPEAHVAWREEVGLLAGRQDPTDLLADYPLKPHELLKDRADRVLDRLARAARRAPAEPAWVVGQDGVVEVTTLSGLVEGGREQVANSVVVLPPSAGALVGGLLDGTAEYDPAVQYDVADQWNDESGSPWRARRWDDEEPPVGMRLVRVLELDESMEDAPPRRWRWYVRPLAADDDGSMTALRPQGLKEHLERAGSAATALVTRLGTDPATATAVGFASRWHDLGKQRAVWQRSVGNRSYPTEVLAKSGGRMQPAELTGYRHELGSLLDVQGSPEFCALAADAQDLALHLIAAHHGRARPCFAPDEAFDPERTDADVQAAVDEVPRRFARLQARYGRWGLARLEALVRAADAWASQPLPDGPDPDRGRVVMSGRGASPAPRAHVRGRSFRVLLDVTNPGQFLACCGLLELSDRIWGDAEGWFEEGTFTVAAGGTVSEVVRALLAGTADPIVSLSNGQPVPALIAPLRLSLPEARRGNFTLDAWTAIRAAKGQVGAFPQPPWNFWSGQQTSLRIWNKLHEAASSLDTFDEGLLLRRMNIGGRFGFDPGPAWNALDVGFSPDAQGLRVAASPVVELLAAVGVQRFRPRVSRDHETIFYSTWGQPLPTSVAAAAASGLLEVRPARRFQGRVVARASYAALGYATPLNGADHD